MTEFVEIKEYEGKYLISKSGEIYRQKYPYSNDKLGRQYKEGFVKQRLNVDGYWTVSLNGKNRFVHRLIAQTFIPNVEQKPQINHRNGIKTDNSLDNLEWCTSQENIIHSFATGLQIPLKGEKKAQSKLSEAQVKSIKRSAGKTTQTFLAQKYGVDKSLISRLQSGQRWKHLGGSMI